MKINQKIRRHGGEKWGTYGGRSLNKKAMGIVADVMVVVYRRGKKTGGK